MRPLNADGRAARPNRGRCKWPVWLIGGALVIAMGMGSPVHEIRASTDDFPSTAPGGTVAHPATGSATRPDNAASDPEPAEQTPALDGREATAGQQPPAVESTPGELDTFSPSEAIEADQGVDFPYDI